jgi:hypothetical protein
MTVSGLGRGIGPIRVAWLKGVTSDFNRIKRVSATTRINNDICI